ncbi:fimbrial protein [Morganella morganii]|uniref:fimbrial protein n=1 Tax=Morganella morganii TaxID=582 RepID=UPI0015E67964|nr:fimbrial protein [Morganella morganii]QXO41476.1 fimbrial protein [Morganella morganii]QXO45174.1 fimbrial protein [Morganella morganii]QXO48679.1 fimbrial protein [Morganella morganii]QXO52544.1 fimbrial protein [Morganella morganii]QXO56458.1 fimbrial protein [Morganella morganii]
MTKYITIVIFILSWHTRLPAVDYNYGTQINFKGRLFEPGCEFNGGKNIDINFGLIGTKKVDGVNYAKRVDVPMNCKETEGKKLYLQIQGVVSDERDNVVKTSNDDVGVAFQDTEGNPVKLNQFFGVTSEYGYSFVAVPVKNDISKPLSAGYFISSATLVSAYF